MLPRRPSRRLDGMPSRALVAPSHARALGPSHQVRGRPPPADSSLQPGPEAPGRWPLPASLEGAPPSCSSTSTPSTPRPPLRARGRRRVHVARAAPRPNLPRDRAGARRPRPGRRGPSALDRESARRRSRRRPPSPLDPRPVPDAPSRARASRAGTVVAPPGRVPCGGDGRGEPGRAGAVHDARRLDDPRDRGSADAAVEAPEPGRGDRAAGRRRRPRTTTVRVRGAVLLHRRRAAGCASAASGATSRPGDCAVIPPGVEHKLENPGDEPLVLLCCCAPPYSHEDTVLTEEPRGRVVSRRRLARLLAVLAVCAALVVPAPAERAGRRHRRPEGRHVQRPAVRERSASRTRASRCPGTRWSTAGSATRSTRWLDGARGARASSRWSASATRACDRRKLPTPARFKYDFRQFRARYPWVTTFATWNEANHCGEPTCHRPQLVAAYYRAMHARVPEVHDPRRRAAGHAEHGDVGRRSSSTHLGRQPAALLGPAQLPRRQPDAHERDARRCCSTRRARSGSPRPAGSSSGATQAKVGFPESAAHAAKATRWVFDKLVPLSRRITRVYLYHWNAIARRQLGLGPGRRARPARARRCGSCAASCRRPRSGARRRRERRRGRRRRRLATHRPRAVLRARARSRGGACARAAAARPRDVDARRAPSRRTVAQLELRERRADAAADAAAERQPARRSRRRARRKRSGRNASGSG